MLLLQQVLHDFFFQFDCRGRCRNTNPKTSATEIVALFRFPTVRSQWALISLTPAVMCRQDLRKVITHCYEWILLKYYYALYPHSSCGFCFLFFCFLFFCFFFVFCFFCFFLFHKCASFAVCFRNPINKQRLLIVRNTTIWLTHLLCQFHLEFSKRLR